MKIIKLIVAAGIGLMLASCASNAPKNAIVPDNRPEWVMKGGEAFKNEPVTVFYGVGVANAMPNMALLRETADNRARVDIAKAVRAKVSALIRDYMNNHRDYFNENSTGSDEFAEYVSKTVVDEMLMGAKIVDRWQDPKTGDFYSLAKMDASNSFYEQYKQAMRRAMSEKHLAFVEEKRDEALKYLDEEIEKQKQREKEIFGK